MFNMLDLTKEQWKKIEGQVKSLVTDYAQGFHELVIDFENWLSDELPNEWYVYYEDGDIWVARRWNDIDEINEDLKHLVNE